MRSSCQFSEQTLPVVVEDRQIAGVRTYVVRAEDVPDTDDSRVYLHIHGGALIYGGGAFCRLTTSVDAMTTGMITWGVDYRMAPRHPYPAALDDCIAVYRALLQVRDPRDVFVGGASAGGNLAAALMVRAKDEGLPMPAALVLLTPEVDLTESGDTFQTLNGIDNVLASLRDVNRLYAGGHDLTHPYLSPLFADVTGFPPTFLQSGTRDLFLSNTVRMHRKLRAAGVDVELHVFEAMPHGGFNGAPEDLELSGEVQRFLARHRRPA
jgi:monoterpene epsilon-lactone hydrolase